MKKENLMKRLGKGLGKKVLPYFMAGALAFLNYGCGDVNEFVESKPEKPEEPIVMLAPVAMLTANPTEGKAPLNVRLDGSGSYARTPNSYLEKYLWDFDGDGNTDATTLGALVNYIYENAGEYNASLIVVDNQGQESDKALEKIVVKFVESKKPVAMLIAQPTEGDAPLEVSFDGSLSYARKGHLEKYLWDFDGDGNTDSITSGVSGAWVDHVYEEGGEYDASLVVEDSQGQESDKALEKIVVNEEIAPLDQIAFRSFLPFGTIPDCGLCDDIYIMDDNGENLRRLTTNTGEEMEPTWSPDGSRIAYAAISASIGGGDPINNNNGLFVINFNGTGEEKLYGVEGRPEYTRYPDWSPDGLKIAFTYFFIKENSAEDRNGISVFDLESKVVTQLTSDPCPRCFSNGSPSWSPDGSRIVFDAYRNNSTDIWIMNADGSGQEKIYSGGTMPDWSPDGLEIVFVSPPSEPKIYIMKINDGSITQITKDPSFKDYQPDWSPDGSRIAFSRWAPGMGVQIYIMNKDGSEQTHLPIPEHSESPAWKPKKED